MYRLGTKIAKNETFLLDENTSNKEVEAFLKRHPQAATAVFTDREVALKFIDDNTNKGKVKGDKVELKQESGKSVRKRKTKAKVSD